MPKSTLFLLLSFLLLVPAGTAGAGPADAEGIVRFDVLLALGRHDVPTLTDLGQVLEVIEPGAQVEIRVLRIERRGKMQRTCPIQVR